MLPRNTRQRTFIGNINQCETTEYTIDTPAVEKKGSSEDSDGAEKGLEKDFSKRKHHSKNADIGFIRSGSVVSIQ